MVKHCARCTKPFECGAPHRGCWCEQVTLDQERWKEEKESFENCLCPACLTYFAMAPKG
jgi:hypothetical protein